MARYRKHEYPSLRVLPPHSWRRMKKPRASYNILYSSQESQPPVMPFELALFAPWPFLPNVHLVVPWVVLAPQCAWCGEACSFGSTTLPVPRLSLPILCSSRVPPCPWWGWWRVIEAEGEHGNFKCPVLLETNPPYPNPAGICNHLALTSTSRKQNSPCWGHCASMADGHVCQLPRDLS